MKIRMLALATASLLAVSAPLFAAKPVYGDWGYDPAAAGPSRTVDTHAARLRQKLEQAGAEPLVQNVRGVGWRLTR